MALRLPELCAPVGLLSCVVGYDRIHQLCRRDHSCVDNREQVEHIAKLHHAIHCTIEPRSFLEHHVQHVLPDHGGG
eukprot:7101148-Pyramimonas_sp.AAC.1